MKQTNTPEDVKPYISGKQPFEQKNQTTRKNHSQATLLTTNIICSLHASLVIILCGQWCQ